MSSLHPAGGEELCPFEGRRTSRELYVKLVVVHFAVLTAYAHLMHLRREPKAWLSYPFVLASPLGGVVSLVILPLSALLIQALRHRGDGSILKQSFGLLCGRVEHYDDPQPVPVMPQAASEWPPKLSYKVVRRVAMLLALLGQCIASVWLYARRVSRGSDAQYDYRVLQLAALGMSAAVLSIVQLVFRPIHPRQKEYPRAVAWLCWIRPVLPRKMPKGSRDAVLAYIFTHWASAGLGPLYADAFPWSRNMVNWLELTGSVFIAFMTDMLPFLYYVLIPLGIIVLVSIGTRSALVAQIGLALIGLGLILMVLIMPVSTLGAAIGSGPLFGFGQLVWLLRTDANYEHYKHWTACPESSKTLLHQGPDWNTIDVFTRAPLVCPCPQAWKDDYADYIWWLA